MNKKLSELSKPVATVDVQRGRQDGNIFAVAWSSAGHALPDGPHFTYSQEYVSALDKVAQFWIGESAEWKQRAEDAEKRIAELELDELAMRASSRAVHEAQENHINQQQDRIDSLEKTNAGLGRGLAAAEQKLATPVRLPTEHELHQVACSECAGNCLELVESTVRAAGFTVEGDE